MISILKHGNVPRPFAVCRHCGCEFTYDDEDVKKNSKGDEYIICPDCKDEICLYEPEHPELASNEFLAYGKKRAGFVINGHFKEDEG